MGDNNGILDLGDGIKLHKDGLARVGGRLALPSDVPVRLDLPPGHPLRAKRALKVVPSGLPDCTVGLGGILSQNIVEELEIDSLSVEEIERLP